VAIDTDAGAPEGPRTVAVIGAGRVGTAFGVLLERAGHRVVAAVGTERSRERVKKYLPFADFFLPADAPTAARPAALVILGVPDDVIRNAASALAEGRAFHRGQVVMHLSGSVGLDAVDAAELLGADVLALHPLQTFPDVEEGIARLPGSHVAVTARNAELLEVGEDLAREVGGIPFRLDDDVKPLYHAAAVFCSNYLVTVEGVAEHLFRAAGVADPLPLFAPLARAALEATLSRGAAEAITGPAARGDAGTILRNLNALVRDAPDVVPAYVALARLASALGASNGTLPEEARRRVDEVLDRWS
jgi:predicted short-subunit dehydrogenase-like oxidoreductase (DUF2520 family)